MKWPPWNGLGSWGQERSLSRWVQGERSLLARGVQGSAIAPMIHGSVQVERDFSKPCEWWNGDTFRWLGMGSIP